MNNYSVRQICKYFNRWSSSINRVNKLLELYNHCLGDYDVFIKGCEELDNGDAKLMLLGSSIQNYKYKLPKQLPDVGTVSYYNFRLALEAIILSEIIGGQDKEFIFDYLMSNTTVCSRKRLYEDISFLKYTKGLPNIKYHTLQTGTLYSGSVKTVGASFFDIHPKFITFTNEVKIPVYETDDSIYSFMPQMFVGNPISDFARGSVLILGAEVGYISYLTSHNKSVVKLTVVEPCESLFINLRENYLPGFPKDKRNSTLIYKADLLSFLAQIDPNTYDTILVTDALSADEYLKLLAVIELNDIDPNKVFIEFEDACLWELFSFMSEGFYTDLTNSFTTISDSKQELASILCHNLSEIDRLCMVATFKKEVIKNLDAIMKVRNIKLDLKG